MQIMLITVELSGNTFSNLSDLKATFGKFFLSDSALRPPPETFSDQILMCGLLPQQFSWLQHVYLQLNTSQAVTKNQSVQATPYESKLSD